jgi:FecR protein
MQNNCATYLCEFASLTAESCGSYRESTALFDLLSLKQFCFLTEYGPSGGFMGIARSSHLALLLLSGSLTFIPYAASGQAASSKPQSSLSAQTYPQVVRLSYVEGDVRITRGKAGKEASGSEWEAAVAGLPIETGFNLVTGQGRAEIEFEDASTVYLAENSALAFNDLHTTNEVPYTNLALLTGTATLYVLQSPDTFTLLTPTARVTPARLRNSYFRITSYADGNAIAARANMAISLPDAADPLMDKASSGTFYYRGGTRVAAPAGADTQSFAGWDQWVDERVAAHNAATNAVMVQAGLDAPIPGLADLNGKGKFFACEPYGTCWEPNEAAEPDSGPFQGEAEQGSSQESARMEDQSPAMDARMQPQVRMQAAQAFGQAGQFGGYSGPAGFFDPNDPNLYDGLFPCTPNRSVLLMLAAMNSGGAQSIDPFGYGEPYNWARCHAGYWIHYRNHRRYTWVVGRKIHHTPPVKWVKYNGKTAFVPRNPKDEAGKLPLNREHGVFVVKGKEGEPVRFAEYDPKEEIKPLDKTPKEFQKPVYARLQPAAAPHPEVRTIEAHSSLAATARSEQPHATLAFDSKSQSFLIARQITAGGKTSTVMQPFDGHSGELQARAVGVDSHGNYNMHVSSSVGSGGHFGGTSGGMGSSGGGASASHSASFSSSSSASSSASSGASASASHH